MSTIGDNIKLYRESLKLTQEELAKKMGYKSKSTINKIELGINDITQSKIVAFAKVLQTTPTKLMGWTIPDEKEVNERNGKNIKDFRIEKKLSQEQLAKIAGVSKDEIEAWENGQLPPKMNALFKIADKFNTSVGNILKDSPMSNNFLSEKDEKDIAKRIAKLNEDIDNQQGLMFDGEPMSEEGLQCIKDVLEFGIRQAKIINKKYTPKKYLKAGDNNDKVQS